MTGDVTHPPLAEPGDDPVKRDAELAQLRAERDSAVAMLDKRARRQARGSMFRRWTVGVLVFLTAILIPVTIAATWAHRTVLNTDQYVSTVGPIAKDPAVTAALSRIVTDQVFTSLDPQQTIASALPPKAAFLAGPITNGVKGFVQDTVNKIMNTSQFQQLWVSANRTAHATLIKVLKGNSKLVTTTNGEVVLSLVPLINQVLVQVQSTASELVGKSIKLPQLTGTELPSAACAKLSTVLHRPLPSTCGQIALFPADKLNQAQWAVRAFDRIVIALLIVTPLLFIAALWLSRRRRRTLLQVTVATMLVTVVLRRTVMWLQNTLINTGKPENKSARSAIVHQVLHGFFTATAWALWISLAVLVVALLTGPYLWAVRVRGWARDGADGVVRLTRVAAGGDVGVGPAGAWIRAHLDPLRIVGAALGLLIVLIFNVNFIWLLVILVLVAGYEFWLYRVGVAVAASGPTRPSATSGTTTASGTGVASGPA
jgi:hypothetical protein